MRKAQGLSINTIIIAAIALIVLVLIVLIVSGNLRNWNIGANNCVTNGGFCDTACDGEYEQELPRYSDSCGSTETEAGASDDTAVNLVCCITAGPQ